MRRGKPAKAKVKTKLPVARKSPKKEAPRVHELEKRLAEALAREAATSEILGVIASSPTDVQPVFDTIIQNAVRLLGGFSGVVTRIVGGQLHLAALTSTNPAGDAAQKALWPKPVKEDRFLHGQVITALEPRFVSDVESDPSVPPGEVVVARARGYRSIIAVPLVRDDRPLGSMTVTRRAPGPFSDSEIALLRTFADQAVIAIENVRLFTELQEKNQALTQAHAQVTEALEQQTATAEVLKVISHSTFDLQPVLETVIEIATKLCDANIGVIHRFDGELFRVGAFYGSTSPEYKEFWQGMELRPGRGSPVGGGRPRAPDGSDPRCSGRSRVSAV